MNQRKINRLLKELTPEIRAYLFPGLPEPLESPGVFESILEEMPSPMAMYDMADEEMLGSEMPGIWEESIHKRERKTGKAHKPILNWHKASEDECREIIEPDAEALDPRTEQILAEIRCLQEKYGVTIDELELILGYTVKLSPIHITRAGKIFLSDYDNKEVKMPNVAKALYFLYLRHPEGLRYKEIADHKDELLHIYEIISGRDIPEEIEKSIDLLVDPYGNALNVNASRVKAAFRNVVSDRIARFYYISGAAGDVKKVPLDRDLVLWDY